MDWIVCLGQLLHHPAPLLLDYVPPPALSSRGGFFRHDVQYPFFGTPDDGHRGPHADLFLDQEPMQVIDAGRRMLPIGHDDVAFPQARALRRAVRLDSHDLDAARDRQVVRQYKTARERHVLPAYADEAAPDLAVLDQPAGDELGGVDANGETNPLRRQDHSGVDTDGVSLRIHQRTAGIARIKRGVRLADAVDQPT